MNTLIAVSDQKKNRKRREKERIGKEGSKNRKRRKKEGKKCYALMTLVCSHHRSVTTSFQEVCYFGPVSNYGT